MDTIEQRIQRGQQTQHGWSDIQRAADDVVTGNATQDSLRMAKLPQGNTRRIILHDCGYLPWLECPTHFFTELRAFLDPLISNDGTA